MRQKPLRVGFDLDGVILYNPVRVLRPLTSLLSKTFLHKKEGSFYIPKSPIEQQLWRLLHKTSFIPSRGLNDLKRLVDEKKIEAYIVTGRYQTLKKDFEKWIKQIEADKHFKGYFFNASNQQPHEFKSSMIKKLGLDMFVEDNWDIVRQLHLNGSHKNTKVLWISNLLDSYIKHPHKFPNLKMAIKYIETNLS